MEENNKKRWFIVSDIHSFGDILEKTLKQCGFDKNNKNHTLIVCGYIFDRGTKTVKVYNYLKSIPKKRCILIKGNHEQLYMDLLNKYFPEPHDFSNGTVLTFAQIAGYGLDAVYDLRMADSQGLSSMFGDSYDMPKESLDLWRDIKKKVRESEITKWLQSKQWVNYYESDKYIFVHSFIPLIFDNSERGLNEDYCIYYGWTQMFKYKENWREATDLEWSNAAWGCPYKFFDAGLFNQEKEKGKVLVCGHYRCSEFNVHYLNSNENDHSLYFGKNLIAIDATTALSNKINVLIIDEDGKCYDQGGLLEYKKPIPIIETVTLSEEEYKKVVEEEYDKYAHANDVTNY